MLASVTAVSHTTSLGMTQTMTHARAPKASPVQESHRLRQIANPWLAILPESLRSDAISAARDSSSRRAGFGNLDQARRAAAISFGEIQ